MTPRKENDWLIAIDGLRARKNGAWGKEQLSFLDDFVPPALQATTRKLQRYYVDLFAGPGRNVVPETEAEFEGSAIRALSMAASHDPRVHFTSAYLVNKDSHDQAALEQRVKNLRAGGRCPVPDGNLQFLTHDANRLVGRIMSEIDQKAYVLVLADITNPSQLRWSTIKALTSLGHKSVDLYLLFPLEMALNRMLSYNPETVEQSAAVLDEFFGTPDWREIVSRRVTKAQSPELRRQILDLYMNRLKGLGWAHVLVAREIHRERDIGMYRMIYASNHDAGSRIAEWSAARARDKDQHRLL